MTFLGNLLKGHAQNVADKVTEIAVELNPDVAGEAEIQTLVDELSAINGHISALQIETEHLAKLVADDQRAIDEKSRAAEILLNGDETKKAKANGLLTEIESVLLPKLKNDSAQLDAKKKTLEAYEAQKADHEHRLSTARTTIETAKSRRETSQVELDRAQQQERDAKELAGFSRPSSHLTIASDALNAAADKAEVKARQARLNAESLTGLSGSNEDADVKAALAEARGESTSPQSAADRLAAIRAKTSDGASR